MRVYECPGAERAFACLNAGVMMANQVDGENGLYSESAKGAGDRSGRPERVTRARCPSKLAVADGP